MAEKSSFFNAVINNGIPDRIYKADSFADYFGSFLENGVFPNPNTNLEVKESSNMRVVIKQGKAWINGYMYHNTDDLSLNIDFSDGILRRIDRVVVRLDYINRQIKTYIKKGEASIEPVAKQLQRDNEIYELGIADISVEPGALNITQNNITDTRLNSELCGMVNSLIKVDANIIIDGLEDEFYFWFENIKGMLDEDVAGNLANRITKLEDKVGNGLTADNITISDVENSFMSDTVEGALQELFIFASSYKDAVARAIGEPILATDTSEEAESKILSLESKFKDNLMLKGVSIDSNDKFNSLIDKVDKIASNITNYSDIPNWANIRVGDVWTPAKEIPFLFRHGSGDAVGNTVHIFEYGIHYIYYADTNDWTKKTNNLTTTDFGVQAVGTNIYRIGGGNDGTQIRDNKMYDTVTDTWTTKASMGTGRYSVGICSVGTNIFVMGGKPGNGNFFNTNEMYDTVTNTWTNRTVIPIRISSLTIESVDSNIYVMGGYDENGNSVNTNRVFNTSSSTWTTKSNMPAPRRHMGSSVIGKNIHLIGGYSEGTNKTNTHYLYDVLKDKWATMKSMPTFKSICISGLIGNKIFIMGDTSNECYLV